MADEKTQENAKVRLVYIGPCTTSDEKLGGIFLPITDEQLREKRLGAPSGPAIPQPHTQHRPPGPQG